MDQGGEHIVEDQAIGDPLAMTAQGMGGNDAGTFGQQGRELDPERLDQGSWKDRHGGSSITEVGTP